MTAWLQARAPAAAACCTRRCRSTRCTPARGAGCREDWRPLNWDELAEQLIPYVRSSASRTSSCCRSWRIRSAVPGATRCSSQYAPQAAFGEPRRVRALRRSLPRRRHRRDPRLGAGALSDRSARPGVLRRHAAVRARRSARGLSPGVEHRDLQPRTARGACVPDLERAALAGALSRRRAARRRGGLDAVSRLRAPRGRVDPESSTAAARISRRSTSCAI